MHFNWWQTQVTSHCCSSVKEGEKEAQICSNVFILLLDYVLCIFLCKLFVGLWHLTGTERGFSSTNYLIYTSPKETQIGKDDISVV